VVKDGLLTVTAASDEPIPPVDAPKPKGARPGLSGNCRETESRR
jgi:hypothetical protein